MVPMTPLRSARRAGIAAALAALPLALAYRFALVYRVRAGYPRRHPPVWLPDALGLPYETLEVPTPDGLRLPAWFIPAGPSRAPGVVLVHGWESARDRTLPHAQVLHAAGFHVLTFDVRGHGANDPETLPMSVGEYAADARAAVAAMLARPGGLAGGDPRPLDGCRRGAGRRRRRTPMSRRSSPWPRRQTRTGSPARRSGSPACPIPGPIAWPLAWLTTRVYLRPRGHTIPSVSATRAVREIEVPVMLVHGEHDGVVPVGHLAQLATARRAARPHSVTETMVVEDGRHSWLYEFPAYRAAIARFLATTLAGPVDPDVAAALAEAVPAVRLPEPERLTTLDEEPGGFRSLAQILAPSRARRGPGRHRWQRDRSHPDHAPEPGATTR